jgi:hypothetical protein
LVKFVVGKGSNTIDLVTGETAVVQRRTRAGAASKTVVAWNSQARPRATGRR